MGLDALEQRAANNAMARLACLIDAIDISAKAVVLEEKGESGARRTIASHMKYKTNTIKKLAAMRGLPDDAIDLELPVGTYWVAIQHHAKPVDAIAFLKQQAIPEQMSPAEAKRALGVEVVRESRLAKLEAELDQLRNERQEIAAWLVNEVHDFGSDIVKGVRMLLERLREVQDGT